MATPKKSRAQYMREWRARRSSQAYEAAQQSNDRSTLPYITLEDSESPDKFTRHQMVTTARYLENSFPLFEKILTLVEVHGVGTGISAQAVTPNDEFNISATDYFERWADSKFCTVNQELTLYQIQALGSRFLIRDGEFFLLLTKSPSGYRQVQLLSTEQVAGTGEKDDESIEGLYIDNVGKVIAYNIWDGGTYTKVDASNVIHVKRTTKGPNQLRGVSAFASALNNARDHKDIWRLIKLAIRWHSSQIAQITKKSGHAEGGSFGSVQKKTSTADNGPAKRNFAVEKVYGSYVAYMNPDEEIKLTQVDSPTQNFQNFLTELARSVCNGVGLSYEFVISPKDLNGTGNRVVLGQTNAFFRIIIQETLIDEMLKRIYGWIIAGGVVDGKLNAGDIGEKMYAVFFTKPEEIGIDKGYDTAAAISLIQNNLMSYETYYAAKGKDYKAEFKQIKAEKDLLTSLGITPNDVAKKETKTDET